MKLPRYILFCGRPPEGEELARMEEKLYEEGAMPVIFDNYYSPIQDALVAMCYGADFMSEKLKWNSEEWLNSLAPNTQLTHKELLGELAVLVGKCGPAFLTKQFLAHAKEAEKGEANPIWLITNAPNGGEDLLAFPPLDVGIVILGPELLEPEKFIESLKIIERLEDTIK